MSHGSLACFFGSFLTEILIMQSLEVWNMVKNQSLTVQAHEGLIAALAQSPVTGMVASASHDHSVKVWK
jgi:WD40 repeat protein